MAGGFGPLRSLGERQLQIQFTLSSAYDARAMGVLALNGALAAAAIAADTLIGKLWFISLAGLLASSLPCIVALSTGGDDLALDIKTAFDEAETRDADAMDQFLANSIAEAIGHNDWNLQIKRALASVAIILTAATTGAATLCVLIF